eukprot:2580127-Amphidinium_carterae.1
MAMDILAPSCEQRTHTQAHQDTKSHDIVQHTARCKMWPDSLIPLAAMSQHRQIYELYPRGACTSK